jgi:hypothetical protein
MDGRIMVGPIRRAWIGLAMAALAPFATPAVASADEPEITRTPWLSGSTLVGGRLDAVGASWRGWPTVSASWYWLRCDSDSLRDCNWIDGARAPFYTATSADLGKRLRAVLWVSNRDGSDYAWTSSSAAVTSPPPPPVAPTPVPPPVTTPPPAPVASPPVVPEAAAVAPKMMRPTPLVRIRGWLTERGARLTLLTVRAPKGARISVSCSGIGCPRTAPAQAAEITRLRAYEGMLRAGARLVIRVTKPGFIGKHSVIRIRRGKQPLRRDLCLFPGDPKPKTCPAA